MSDRRYEPDPVISQKARPDQGEYANAAQQRLLHGGVTLEEATRLRAYQLWELAGCPTCDGTNFWLEAVSELLEGFRAGLCHR